MIRLLVTAIAASTASSCSPLASTLEALGVGTLDPVVCQPAHRLEGTSCIPKLPEGECPANTRPAYGSETCLPVGATTCAPGFTTSPTGWGCDAVIPTTPCTGATREVLGQPDCQPVGDCDAPFPPATATLFVDDNYAGAQLDATHFRTIGSALAAAPAGAVIAIEAGQYAEGLEVTRSVSFIGRCARDVVMSPSPTRADYPAFNLTKKSTVRIKGMTLSAFVAPISAGSASQLDLEQVVIAGGTIVALTAFDDAQLTLTESVIRDMEPGANQIYGGYGATLLRGGKLSINDSSLSNNRSTAIYAQGDNTTVSLDRTIIRETRQTKSLDEGGVGIHALEGTQVRVHNSLFTENHDFSINAWGAAVTVTSSVIRNTLSRRTQESGVAINMLKRANVEITGTTLSDNPLCGLSAEEASTLFVADSVVQGQRNLLDPSGAPIHGTDGSTLTIVNTALIDNDWIGVSLFDHQTNATITGSLIRDVNPSSDGYGVGVDVRDGACLEVEDTSVVAAMRLALYLENKGSEPPCQARLRKLVVLDVASNADGQGRGVTALLMPVTIEDSVFLSTWEAALIAYGPFNMTIDRTLLRSRPNPSDARGAMVLASDDAEVRIAHSRVDYAPSSALAFVGARASVIQSVIANNAIGLTTLRNSTVSLVSDAQALATLAPGEVLVSPSTIFDHNVSNLGNQEFPLPNPFAYPAPR